MAEGPEQDPVTTHSSVLHGGAKQHPEEQKDSGLESTSHQNDGYTSSDKHTFSASAQAIIDKLTRAYGGTGDEHYLPGEKSDPECAKDGRDQPFASAVSCGVTSAVTSEVTSAVNPAVILGVTSAIPPEVTSAIPSEEHFRHNNSSAFDGKVTAKTGSSINEDTGFAKRMEPSYSSRAQLDLVNFRFERLMSEKKKIHTEPFNSTFYERNAGPKAWRNVEDILQEYSGETRSKGSFPISSQLSKPRKMSRLHGDTSRTGLMINVSQNNESLDPPSSEVDQIRRHGSSVDAEVGDYMKTYYSKNSYPNVALARSKTSLTPTAHSSGVDERHLPERIPSESEVDFRPSSRSYLGETYDDKPSLNFSFQRERERLRQLEFMIKKSPLSGYTGSEEFQTWKSSIGYKSRFMAEMNSEFKGRKAMSATDYRFTPDYMPTSPDKSNALTGKSLSSHSYRNPNTFSSPTGVSYPRDFSPGQYGLDQGGLSSTKVHTHDPGAYGMTPSLSPHSFHRDIRYKAKDLPMAHAKSKRFDTKKNRNMSKSIPEIQPPKKKKTTINLGKSKSSVVVSGPQHGPTAGHEARDVNTSRHTTKRHNKLKSCRSTSHCPISGVSVSDKPCQDRHGPTKYQPYQPLVQEDPNNTMSWANDMLRAICHNRQGNLQSANDIGTTDNQTCLANHFTHANNYQEFEPAMLPVARKRSTKRSNSAKSSKGKDVTRSKSDCRNSKSVPSTWHGCLQESHRSDSGISQSQESTCDHPPSTKSGKKSKTKTKKTTRAAACHKKTPKLLRNSDSV